MSEIAEYFKREKYINRRLSVLILGGTVLLVPIGFASGQGRIPIHAFEWSIFAYVAFVAVAVVRIVRGAYAKFPKSKFPDNSPLDDASRRKLRRRVWMLEFFVVFYGIGLVNALIHAGRQPWLPIAIGATVTLLIEIVLIKAILRLKSKLKVASESVTPQKAGAAARSQ